MSSHVTGRPLLSRDTLAKTTAKIAALPLAPGDVWEYNVTTDVLGWTIGVASGIELPP